MCTLLEVDGQEVRVGYSCFICGRPILARPTEAAFSQTGDTGIGCKNEGNPLIVNWRGKKGCACPSCASKSGSEQGRLHDPENRHLQRSLLRKAVQNLGGTTARYCENAVRRTSYCPRNQ